MSEESIQSFIRDEIGADNNLTFDTNLFAEGYLDSYEFLELISSIESHYDITIDFTEFDPSNLTQFGKLVTTCEGLIGAESKSMSVSMSESNEDMVRAVFVGNGRPMQKVLSNLEDFPRITFDTLYTNEDKSSKVVSVAKSLGIDVQTTDKLLNREDGQYFDDLAPDILINVNSTVIFPKDLLLTPRQGCINMHPGKLPEYAGLHTHQWALLNDESQFGSTLHWMTPEIDAGPIIYRETFPIGEDDTGLQLFLRAIDTGAQLTMRALRQIADDNELPRKTQDHSNRQVYSTSDLPDGQINWNRPARDIYNFVRAADYRPFESPTYEPYIDINGQVIKVREVQILDQCRGEPGEILPYDETLTVGTFDRDVKVLTMELSGESVTGTELQRRFDIASRASL